MLYQTVTLLALVLSAPFLLARRWEHYLPTLTSRLGRSNQPPAVHTLWIHAVSVGEVEVARTFLDRLARREPTLASASTLLTTVTPTGQQRACKTLQPKGVRVGYLPFELGFAQRSFLRRNQPKSLVLVEGELWPLLMRRLRQQGVPIVMINGRISDRSFLRLQRIHGLAAPMLRPLLDPVQHFGVQTEQDRDRLLALGVLNERITITGNLKFDAEPPPPLPELGALLQAMANGRPILVAGSTMAGEEALVLAALQSLQDLEPLLILAPRHPERFSQVLQLCREQGFRTVQRSNLRPNSTAKSPAPENMQVLLLDTLGELASTYRWARAAFVGGTLVPTGGHNPIEPARCGTATCVGPSMDNFREIAHQFDSHRAWQQVSSSEALATTWRQWIEQPETARALAQRALALIQQNQGAAERSVDIVLRYLAPLITGTQDVKPSSTHQGDAG